MTLITTSVITLVMTWVDNAGAGATDTDSHTTSPPPPLLLPITRADTLNTLAPSTAGAATLTHAPCHGSLAGTYAAIVIFDIFTTSSNS